MKTANQIQTEARKLFEQFENEEITLITFKLELIKLAIEKTADENSTETSYFIRYIQSQFEQYELSEENHYLLSLNSSGSLLNQFLEDQE